MVNYRFLHLLLQILLEVDCLQLIGQSLEKSQTELADLQTIFKTKLLFFHMQ
jgi:hypothetical protein